VQQFAVFCFKDVSPDQPCFSQSLFERIMGIMGRNNFLKMEGSYHLLLLFEYDWATLNQSQKEFLLDAIEESYEAYGDWMSCFVISELLGEYYCDGEALRVLLKFLKSESETARAFVPHALEHLIKDCPDKSLRGKAAESLLSMRNDPSAKVQRELGESFSNLSRAGISLP
jgi:hypothetical protein